MEPRALPDKEPIYLSPDALAVIKVFTYRGDFSLADVFDMNRRHPGSEGMALYRRSAEQFIRQLDGHWCVDFLECLRNEIENVLQEEYKRGVPKPEERGGCE